MSINRELTGNKTLHAQINKLHHIYEMAVFGNISTLHPSSAQAQYSPTCGPRLHGNGLMLCVQYLAEGKGKGLESFRIHLRIHCSTHDSEALVSWCLTGGEGSDSLSLDGGEGWFWPGVARKRSPPPRGGRPVSGAASAESPPPALSPSASDAASRWSHAASCSPGNVTLGQKTFTSQVSRWFASQNRLRTCHWKLVGKRLAGTSTLGRMNRLSVTIAVQQLLLARHHT